MGELSKRDAETKRENYIADLKKRKGWVREDFEEMDFTNAIQRNEMETYVEEIEREYDVLISDLNEMTFE